MCAYSRGMRPFRIAGSVCLVPCWGLLGVWVLWGLWVCAMPAAKRNLDVALVDALGTGGVSQRTLEAIIRRLQRAPIEGTITQQRSTDLGEQLNTQTIISTIEICSVKSACILMVAITRQCLTGQDISRSYDEFSPNPSLRTSAVAERRLVRLVFLRFTIAGGADAAKMSEACRCLPRDV